MLKKISFASLAFFFILSGVAFAQPQYSSNSTNGTIPVNPSSTILHSLYWAENTYGVAGYIFSFDNCTGSLSNDTFVNLYVAGAGNNNYTASLYTVAQVESGTIAEGTTFVTQAGDVGTNATAAGYIAASTESGTLYTPGGNSNSLDVYIRVNFTPTNIYNKTLSWVEIRFDYNSTATGESSNLGLWNYSSGQWVLVATKAGATAKANQTFNITDANLTWFVNSQKMVNAVIRTGIWAGGNTGNVGLTLDYVQANYRWSGSYPLTNWTNVTKNISSTQGCTVRWCVYSNDSSNQWNETSCVTPFSYTTSTPADTCTYGGSGDWFININDNCTLSSPNTLTGNMIIYGSKGQLVFSANQYANSFYYNVSSDGTWFYNSYRWLY
ncbi:MAG: hypothetical protein V1678_00675 [Candidatus Aenigmatarchaeota archaeon]